MRLIDADSLLEWIESSRDNIYPYEDTRDSGYDDCLYDLEAVIKEMTVEDRKEVAIPQKERVIKGLECCVNYCCSSSPLACMACPYAENADACNPAIMMLEAIELIKENGK